MINLNILPRRGEHIEYIHRQGKRYIKYYYRDIDGEIFSTMERNINACLFARNVWVNEKTLNEIISNCGVSLAEIEFVLEVADYDLDFVCNHFYSLKAAETKRVPV